MAGTRDVGNDQMRLTTAAVLTILTLLTVDTTGQERRLLTGIATDGHSNGVLGINVVIKGTITGTVTDICGRFTIPIDTDEVTLLFHGMSYDDMRTYEIKLNKADIPTDTLVFHLGHWKIVNKECHKVHKKFKRRVIE
jgi:hypothetical protein